MNMEKKNWKIYIPLAVIVLAIVSGAIYWYIEYSSYIKTDDAYVASDNISVSSKVMGRISKLYAQEGDTVKAGELLAELDSVDMVAQKGQIIATKYQTIANKIQAQEKFIYDKKSVKVLEIGLKKAEDDFSRAKVQFDGGVLSKEQYEHISKALEAAKAQYEAAEAQLNVSKAQINSAETAVSTAQAQIGVISAQLANTKLYAPVDGIK
jgi:membrane fusion protein (multidrug efflux system)